jgi:hypothetical protein
MVIELIKTNDILSVNSVDRDGMQLITRAKYGWIAGLNMTRDHHLGKGSQKGNTFSRVRQQG